MQFNPTWYASRQRARSRTKLLVYDDLGLLSVEGRLLSFAGGGTQFQRTIASVELTRQRLNLATYAIVCLLALPLYAVIAYVLRYLFHIPVVVGVAICYAVVPIGMLIGFSTRWIRVTFASGSEDAPSEAYFADAGSLGWRGIFGGTTRMFARIREEL